METPGISVTLSWSPLPHARGRGSHIVWKVGEIDCGGHLTNIY